MSAAIRPQPPPATSSSSKQLSVHLTKSFEFVTHNSPGKPDRDGQRLIRSHASRGKRNKKHAGLLDRSWILQRNGSLAAVDAQYTSIPSRVGSDLSFFTFPVELQPYMQDDIARAIGPMKSVLYPPEICMQVDPALSSWTAYLLADLLYLHCTIFSVEAFLDASLGRGTSPLTQYHFLKTLRLLQDRLDAPHDAKAIADATIMVVSVLALTAELHGDAAAARAHMDGLCKMIRLRGGLGMLRFENPRLPAKICRVDLSVAIRFGTQPLFFREAAMSWDSFINEKGATSGKSEEKMTADNATTPSTSTSTSTSTFIRAADEKLYNVWNDLRAFCHLCNLASQTRYKLLPNTFSEIMASVLYRLLRLSSSSSSSSFEAEAVPVLGAFRLGMTVFASQVFLQWRGMRQRQRRLDRDFKQALLPLLKQDLPTAHADPEATLGVIFWCLVISHTCFSSVARDASLSGHVAKIAKQLRLDTWKDAKQLLKNIMWIDLLHDKELASLFDTLQLREDIDVQESL